MVQCFKSFEVSHDSLAVSRTYTSCEVYVAVSAAHTSHEVYVMVCVRLLIMCMTLFTRSISSVSKPLNVLPVEGIHAA